MRRLAYYDEYTFNHLPPPEQHVHQLQTLIDPYRKRADSYRRRFFVIQVITILLSATITSLSGGWLDKYISVPWAIPVFSALLAFSQASPTFFQFREKGATLQQTADAMDLEHKARPSQVMLCACVQYPLQNPLAQFKLNKGRE